ncbi:fructose-bisphosphate aldolase class I [Candidatus Saccharibacteria bacterium]|nr:fructose-bisphosphate aldolase class I [Candidatus Saccharibacteria bacterium]
MNILVVGNVIKDIYLNLDSRTENFETDKNHIKWLNLAFNAEEHFFFNRNSNFGGAAVTLEVLSRMNLPTTITGSDLKMTDDGFITNQSAKTYRYILVADGNPCYIAPTNHEITNFATPDTFYDYIYIDRSALLSPTAVTKISSYLDLSKNTKLITYLKDQNDTNLNQLAPQSDLVFYETKKPDIPPEKLIHISETNLSYQNIHEVISVERIDMMTHLSAYSIAAATILGSFIIGKSVEESLRLARINVENSTLNSTLNLAELQEISDKQNPEENLELIAASLVLAKKGILAADESGGSIHKKFEKLNIADTYENRRDYRNIFFTTKDLENYVNGVILFDETARQQADNGQNFTDFLISRRIIPGIKVDQGLEKFENSEETYTKGLDGLDTRLREYYRLGLRFAKWRAAFEIHLDEQGNILTPTDHAITENCRILAEYASACQSAGLVPIVEPEVVYDGYYSIDQSASITGKILDELMKKLADYHVNLRACILKVNMIIAGKQFENQSTPAEVGTKTAEVLKNHLPEDLAGVVFLSGGQTPEQATDNLREIEKNGPFPWPVTFSFARALQDPALYAWNGDNNNVEKARQAFLDRLIANTEVL